MITAKDIRESTFSRAARGYKVDEIDEYLENSRQKDGNSRL